MFSVTGRVTQNSADAPEYFGVSVLPRPEELAKGFFMMISKTAVVGAGNMGSGIAQKIATEGFEVVLVDSSEELALNGKKRVSASLEQAQAKRLFSTEQCQAILSRIHPSGSLENLRDAQLVVEAVFEDKRVKTELFQKLDALCPATTILATNTSSFLVRELCAGLRHPERIIGLHYFYHPAKNRLVEVIGHATSNPTLLQAAWLFQEATGKTPIRSKDAPGFVVNRFFVPWLNEAVRLMTEGYSISQIEKAAKESFGIGMGPFELMNVTGVPITLHAARSLAGSLGSFYAPAEKLVQQVEGKQPWDLLEEVPDVNAQPIVDRLWGVVFQVVSELLEEQVCEPEDIDIGARVGLRWIEGPLQKINKMGLRRVASLQQEIAERYQLPTPGWWSRQKGETISLRRVLRSDNQGVATLQIHRPADLNALDPETLDQLEREFVAAQNDSSVKAIVLAGSGKAFVAGADVKFFVDNIRASRIAEIVRFAAAGQDFFRRIEKCKKPVICRLHGLALGGGAELALACHVIVATPKANMGFPESGIGIYPGLGGTQRLTRRVGKNVARQLLYSGDVIGSAELLELGIVSEVVSPESITDAIVRAAAKPPVPTKSPDNKRSRLAAVVATQSIDKLLNGPDKADVPELVDSKKRIQKKAPLALKAIERLTELADKASLEEGLAAETEGLANIFSTADALEGMSALLEGRRPTFSGK